MRVTIVVVFYKQRIEESKTFSTLKQTLFKENRFLKDIEIILYDNSPEKQEFSPLPYEGVDVSYVHDPRNLGIGTAYNHAWKAAQDQGSEWLLLLDHDTELAQPYINEILQLPEYGEEIAAVVPIVFCDKQMISPVFSDSLRPLQEKRPNAGLQEKPVMAINSGALLRVRFLNEIGGFNQDFPLDYLDHWLFYEIYERGNKVWLLDAALEHELSVMDYSRVSLARYKSIIESEIKFYKNYKQELFQAYKIQLAKRFLKQIITVKDKRIAFCTLSRLFTM